MSLGPWPALKESRVLKMVTREEGKATAQAALKFLGARQAVGGAGRGWGLPGGNGRGFRAQPRGAATSEALGSGCPWSRQLRPLPTCPPCPSRI